MLPARRSLAGSDTAGMVVALDDDAASRGGLPSHATVVRRSSTGKADPDAGPGNEPGEVAPQRAAQRAAAVTKTKPTRRLQPGDLVCGACGEGNPPTRKFCSRCGDELDPASAVRARWWQRLAVWRRKPKQMAAGTRPGEKGARKGSAGIASGTKAAYIKVRAVVGALLLVGGMVYLFVPPFRGAMNNLLASPTRPIVDMVRGWYGGLTDPFVTVPVQRSSARSQLPNRTAQDAFDGNTNSWWAAPWRSRMTGTARPALVVVFDEPVDLTNVVIHSGAPEEAADRFLRPDRLLFRYQSGIAEEVPLAFEEGAQVAELSRGEGTTRVTIVVAGVHARKGARAVALSEIEFKARE